MSEEKKEEKKRLTDAEIEEIVEMDWDARKRWYPSEEDKKKLRNTIEMLEADLKSIRGLKRFIDPGVLVNDRLVIFAKPEEYHHNIGLRAFTGGEFGRESAQVLVNLTVSEAERLRRLLPQVIKCARKKRQLIQLKKIAKEKLERRRW